MFCCFLFELRAFRTDLLFLEPGMSIAVELLPPMMLVKGFVVVAVVVVGSQEWKAGVPEP